jgi:hypothetical protein
MSTKGYTNNSNKMRSLITMPGHENDIGHDLLPKLNHKTGKISEKNGSKNVKSNSVSNYEFSLNE